MRVLRKEPHDVDDGWWEGELGGQCGIFPSLVVEPCAADGSPLTPQVKKSVNYTFLIVRLRLSTYFH